MIFDKIAKDSNFDPLVAENWYSLTAKAVTDRYGKVLHLCIIILFYLIGWFIGGIFYYGPVWGVIVQGIDGCIPQYWNKQ